MKNDIATTIITAIIGIAASYFICNLLVQELATDSHSFNTIEGTIDANLSSPDPEIFNYRALNPTVEVYVGNCTERNIYGECVDESSAQIEEGIIEDSEETENTTSSDTTTNATNNTTNSSNATDAPSNQRTP